MACARIRLLRVAVGRTVTPDQRIALLTPAPNATATRNQAVKFTARNAL